MRDDFERRIQSHELEELTDVSPRVRQEEFDAANVRPPPQEDEQSQAGAVNHSDAGKVQQ